MRTLRLLPLIFLASLVGCANQANVTPGPTARLTSQQQIEKVQNDQKMPDGLKKIKLDTLQHQAGMKP